MEQSEGRWWPIVARTWETGRRLGAVGPPPVEDHLEHARAIAGLIRPERGPAGPARGLDLGTGAGIPGLALAGLLPDMEWVLVDAAARRCRHVETAVAELEWSDRVTVIHGRAEALAGPAFGASFDVIVARLFGPPATTAECAAPLARIGGQVLVTDAPADDLETRWPSSSLAQLGLIRGRRTSDPTIQELHRSGPMEDRFPRKVGVARRRPLW